MLKQYVRTTLAPTAYHGDGKSAPFFEGWYFKVVDAAGSRPLAVIPGIYKGVSPDHSHAFVMVVDGQQRDVDVYRFPSEQFAASDSEFAVRVGGCLFSAETLTLNLPNHSGQLTFENLNSWPVTVRSPGIMGWFAWVPFMECYHGVVSMDHVISGSLAVHNEPISYDGGRGYTEKDWGRSFPQTWIWLQANHFERVGTSLSASIARIPWIGYDFPGFIIGLWHDGVLHRFTTYVGAQLEVVAISAETVHIRVRNRTHRLDIQVQRADGILLPAPTKERGMVPMVNETLGASVSIRLTRRGGLRSQMLVYEGSSQHAGLEVEGDTAILLK